ncbi:exodeoxyribonuclease III [Humitalea sp. 24SJ18S-53]|uniref:exodeoxyribonuclease III n=1 Tax=Humitalea sp. 24SJ18S-53 TaxID=3422307 RepID=UPI003D67116C
MLIATFNVNSIRQRIRHVHRFLERHKPDVLFLQELKCKTEEFPGLELAELGYRVHAIGQTGGRNGVAVVARIPFTVVAEALPGDPEDSQARYIEIAVQGMHLGGLYLPNGNSGGDEGYGYKLRWMERLRLLARARLLADQPFALLGDFNVCPTDADLTPGVLKPTDALIRAETRAAWRALVHLGLTDALLATHPVAPPWTYWDYGSAFDTNRGLRIDHGLLSADLAERLMSAEVDTKARSEEQPSDHAPVIFGLRD